MTDRTDMVVALRSLLGLPDGAVADGTALVRVLEGILAAQLILAIEQDRLASTAPEGALEAAMVLTDRGEAGTRH